MKLLTLMFQLKIISKRKCLFKGTVPGNKNYRTGTVPVNKSFPTGTVPVNKNYPTGTVPVNKNFPTGTVVSVNKNYPTGTDINKLAIFSSKSTLNRALHGCVCLAAPNRPYVTPKRRSTTKSLKYNFKEGAIRGVFQGALH